MSKVHLPFQKHFATEHSQLVAVQSDKFVGITIV